MHIEEEARLLGNVDIGPLRQFIESGGPALWNFECPFSALIKSDRIILRHSRDYNFDFNDIVDWEGMPRFEPYVSPIIEKIKESLGKSNVSAIFLANLPPRENIYPHFDQGEFLEIPSRVHIPIKTNPHVFYRIGGFYIEEEFANKMDAHILAKEFHMNEGEIWEIDNLSYHSVRNGGDTSRWHLIVNIW